jgi:hypothetical protein
MQLALKIAHHDHAYIERRGGHVLYSYMRQASARSACRQAAIERAFARWLEASTGDQRLPSLSGLGLIVMQRAFFAAEDLGRLLAALDDEPSWERLTDATLPELDAIFTRVMTDPNRSLRPFILPTGEQLLDEDLDRTAREGVLRLAQLAAERWIRQLETVMRFWVTARSFAKATMHGFPLIAGSLVTGPPPAGALTDRLRIPDCPSWALALVSDMDHQQQRVETTLIPIPLDEKALSAAVRAGKAATRVTDALAEAQATSIEGGHAITVPLGPIHRLSDEQRTAVEQASQAQPKRGNSDE